MAIINQPTTAIRKTKSTSEIMNPAIANPLGLLNNPIKEKSSPSSQITHPNTGVQQSKNPMSASTKPAAPRPFVLRLSLIIIVWWALSFE